MTATRKYNCKDSELIIGASTILQAAQSHQAFLVTKRPVWTIDYFEEFETKINLATSKWFGVDSAANLRNQTILVNELIEPAYKNITTVRLEIKEGFKNNNTRRNELLTTLGYNNWSGTKEQEGLITMLFAFKQNITPAIQTELIAKGTLPLALTEITAAAQALLDSNVSQEFFKQSKKTQTAAAITDFNDIYEQLMTICKLSRNYFAGNTTAIAQFSFAKVIKALNPGNISTLYDQVVNLEPGKLFILSQVKLTAKSKIILTLMYNLDGIYACRNTDGCYPSASQKLVFEVPLELTKATLQGLGHYLILSNPQAENAKVHIKIQG